MKFSIVFFPIGNVNCRMSERIHALAQQVFGKSFDQCDLQEIRDLVNRYPYFAPAQFLLLEKLKPENSSEYSAQLQKAVLYYHNPLEFEYFISADKFYSELDYQIKEDTTIYDEDLMPSSQTEVPGTLPIEEIASFEEHNQPSEIDEEQNASISVETPSSQPQIEDTIVGETTGQNETTDTVHEESVEAVKPELQMVNTEPAFSEEDLTDTMKQASDEIIDEQKMDESIERVLEREEQQINEPASKTDDLIFEPYHTVDYFASQGIKLSQEETGKDKFGKQLKSFTEWLKTMKRLPASELTKNMDVSSESKVQHLADDSVHDSDVVTEAMAEVWLKQGNKQKAIETFHKLSLLNPSKKAYFATLIENLKHS
jgi:hypothetical protein